VQCRDESVQNVNKTRRPMREVHVSHVIPSFWYRTEHDPMPSKFLVPEKSRTRTHGTRSKFLVRELGRRTWIVCHGSQTVHKRLFY